jgi:hypothetical protein
MQRRIYPTAVGLRKFVIIYGVLKSLDLNDGKSQITNPKERNLPTASPGGSIKDKFNLNAASCGEFNPANFVIPTPPSL